MGSKQRFIIRDCTKTNRECTKLTSAHLMLPYRPAAQQSNSRSKGLVATTVATSDNAFRWRLCSTVPQTLIEPLGVKTLIHPFSHTAWNAQVMRAKLGQHTVEKLEGTAFSKHLCLQSEPFVAYSRHSGPCINSNASAIRL